MAGTDARGIRIAGVALVWACLAMALGGAAAAAIRFELWEPGGQLYVGEAAEPLYLSTVALHGGLMTLTPTFAVAAAALGLVVARGGWRRYLRVPAKALLAFSLLLGVAALVVGVGPIAAGGLDAAKENPETTAYLSWALNLFWQYVYVAAPFVLIAAGVATAPAVTTFGFIVRNLLAFAALFVAGRWVFLAVQYELTLAGPDDPWREFGLAEGVQEGRMHLALFTLLMAATVFTRRGWMRDAAAPYAVLGGLLVTVLWFLLLPDRAIFHDSALELSPVHSIYGALLLFVSYGVAFQWVKASGRAVGAAWSWVHALLLAMTVFAMSAPLAILFESGMPRYAMESPAELANWNGRASAIAAIMVALHALGLARLGVLACRAPQAQAAAPDPAPTPVAATAEPAAAS